MFNKINEKIIGNISDQSEYLKIKKLDKTMNNNLTNISYSVLLNSSI